MSPIRIDVHHYIHRDEDEGRLARMESMLSALLDKGMTMATSLETLQAEVARNTAVDQSAITLLNGLAAQIASLKNDPVALQALSDNLKASSDALAAAVVANTPAEPGPEPVPPVPGDPPVGPT